MREQLPSELLSLRQFLIDQEGWGEGGTQKSDGFGDRLRLFESQWFCVRFVRDRGEWNVELMEWVEPAEWYDVSLVMVCAGVSDTKDVLALDEQVTVLRANWQRVEAIFSADRAKRTHEALNGLREERAKRRFPGLLSG